MLLHWGNIECLFKINFAELTNIEVKVFLSIWVTVQFKSWIVAFPTVLVVAPLTRRLVSKLVADATK